MYGRKKELRGSGKICSDAHNIEDTFKVSRCSYRLKIPSGYPWEKSAATQSNRRSFRFTCTYASLNEGIYAGDNDLQSTKLFLDKFGGVDAVEVLEIS